MYLLTSYRKLIPSLKISPESIRTTARNPKKDLSTKRIKSESKIRNQNRTRQLQENLTK